MKRAFTVVCRGFGAAGPRQRVRVNALHLAICFAGAVLMAPLAWAGPVAQLGHVEGRVLMRLPETKKLEPVKEGRELAWGDTLVTGDATRFEVRPAEGGGLWRVGRRALFSLKDDGARVLAGTVLVQVPAKMMWRVESARSVIALPEGTWIVQAVDNRGLKIVCLDGNAPVQAWGLPTEPEAKALAEVLLKPGELVFLQPGGKAFSPRVAVYLEETLATSRLVGGFPEPVPGMRRLINQATAQRERLKGVSNAVVVGASKAGGFQIAVPTPEQAEGAEGDTPAGKKP